VLRVLHPVNHNKERISDLEQYKDSIDTSMLEFPVEYNSRNIKNFEEVNNLRISIFCLEDKESKVYPLYVSNRNESTRIDLGIYKNHYVLINKLEWLLFFQMKSTNILFAEDACVQHLLKRN
jgi:hypothetical protein